MELGFWKDLPRPIIGLSPMDGVTDAAYRYIMDTHGHPSILMTEFIPVEGIAHGAVKLMSAFTYHKTDTPVIAQIYGVDIPSYYMSAFIVAEMGFSGLDINMGCPDKNVSKRGAGAGMIRQPQHGQNIICETKKAIADWAEGRKIEDVGLPNKIVRYVKDYVKARGITVKRRKIPVSVKTRIGVDKIVTEDWIKTLLEVEPANISLHGRTLKQLYSGQADWEEIGKAAALVRQTNTSILGNGDITSLADAHEKINTYNLDGVLIGRATYGNPWIFAGREATPIERLNIAIEHVQAFYDLTPELNFLSMRKHLAWYCKGIVNAAETRAKLMQVTSVDEVREILQPYIDNQQMIAPEFQQ